MSLGFRKAFGGSARGKNSKAIMSRTAASAPRTSGISGPWLPAWPDSAAPGPGGSGNGGDRSGTEGRVGLGEADDAGALVPWARPVSAADGESGGPATSLSVLGRRPEPGLSLVRGAEERPAVRARWPVARRCPFAAGADTPTTLWVWRCASAVALDAIAAACLVATSRLFVAASSVFADSTGATAAAGARGTMAVAWATAALTSVAIWAVPNGSAARAIAGAKSPQAMAPPRAHARATRVFRPARRAETSVLPSTGR